jgi:protoporphyrinogen/coproporphyrinogen III oxidase
MADSAIVVGAGLSGLAAAYRLQQAGLDVTVLEASDRAGGLARTEQRDGYLIDTGPDLINASFVRYLTLARDVGLGDKFVSCSQVIDVLRDGRAVTVDRRRPLSLVSNPVLSLRGKLALAQGYLRLRPQIRGLDPYALTGHAAADHGTAYDLCARYFNDEVTEQLVDPIVRGFAGTGARNASGLSVLAAFAVGTKKMIAIEGGMAGVPEALARRLDVRCGAQALSVDDVADAVTVGYRHNGATAELTADTCVLAVPYHAAISIWPALREAGGEFGCSLKDLPLMSISLGYAAPSPTPAYSVLVPSNESPEALLVMMQQNKAPDRAPDGKTLVTVFTEAAVTAQMMQRSDSELVDWAARFIESYYPSLKGHRELCTVARWPHTGYWPSPGYWRGISDTRARLPKLGVHVTSTLFGSGGMERAVLGGERAASRVLRAHS